jgi:hypothetical protein
LATGRADLRQEVERLAYDRQALIRRGVVTPSTIDLIQGIIQIQLKKTPKP